jgi:hypothetical protein
VAAAYQPEEENSVPARQRAALPPADLSRSAPLFENPGLPLTDVQFVLAHAVLTTTQRPPAQRHDALTVQWSDIRRRFRARADSSVWGDA